MKILFSPSESKKIPNLQGVLTPEIQNINQIYQDFVKNADLSDLQKSFGYKGIDEIEKTRLLILQNQGVEQSVRLYNGVAYDALAFESLDQESKDFVLENVLIFSNLFGAVYAKEKLPFYRLKQGEGFGEFESKKLYKSLEKKIDEELKNDFVIDLRAEFYKKLYKIKSHYFTFEFLKNGKRVSHYAKYYRGIVLREIAKKQDLNSLEEDLKEYNLVLTSSKEDKQCTTMIFSIL